MELLSFTKSLAARLQRLSDEELYELCGHLDKEFRSRVTSTISYFGMNERLLELPANSPVFQKLAEIDSDWLTLAMIQLKNERILNIHSDKHDK